MLSSEGDSCITAYLLRQRDCLRRRAAKTISTKGSTHLQCNSISQRWQGCCKQDWGSFLRRKSLFGLTVWNDSVSWQGSHRISIERAKSKKHWCSACFFFCCCSWVIFFIIIIQFRTPAHYFFFPSTCSLYSF